MSYGSGMSRLFAERGREQAGERSRYEKELKSAEGAAKRESEGSSLWQTLGSVVGAGVGLWTGGPKGAYKGWQAGKEVGRWGHRGVGKLTGRYDPKDYAVSTDVGRFGVSQKFDLQDVNRQFQEAADAQLWQDVAGTGVSAMSLFNAPDLAGSEWFDKAPSYTSAGDLIKGSGGAPDWLKRWKGTIQ